MAHALMLKGETRRVQLYDDHTFATLAHRPPLAGTTVIQNAMPPISTIGSLT